MRQLLRITATFALALVFTAGIAFGQTSVDLEQSGGSTSDITQKNPSGGQASTLQGIRGGSNLTGGDAFTQEGGSLLILEQIRGAGHVLEGEQVGGFDHFIDLRQRGTAHTAKIDQRSAGGGGNIVRLDQATFGSSPGNDADIFQNGGDYVRGSNFASVVSLPGRKGAKQDGSDNDLDLRQRSGANRLRFAQVGDGNTIDMVQTQASTAEISQGGNGNIVAGGTSSGAPVGTFRSENAELFVDQSGGDVVVGGQTGAGFDSAYINQSGGSNEAELVQQ